MVVGDPTPNATLHYTVFGRHLRTRLRGYHQRLWCVKTRRRGIRPTLAITIKR